MSSEIQTPSGKLPFSILRAVFYVPLYCRARPRPALRLFIWSLLPFAFLTMMFQSVEIVPPAHDFMQPQFRLTAWTGVHALLFLVSGLAVWTMWLRALVRDEVAPGIPLGLGPDEGRLIASMLLWQLAFWVIAIPVRILARIPVIGLLALPFSAWVSVRIAPLAAYSVAERRIVVFEAWRVTEFVFWSAMASLAVNSVISIVALFTLGGVIAMMGFDNLAAVSGAAVSMPVRLLAFAIAGPVATAIFAFALGPGCYMVWRHERRPRTVSPTSGESDPAAERPAPPAP